MDLKKLFNDNKAVSPVVGVVLMVAITVILAAAIGSSVFSQGTVESAPQANINAKFTDGTTLVIEHLGGDTITWETTKIRFTKENGGTDGLGGDVNTDDGTIPSPVDQFSVGDIEDFQVSGSNLEPGTVYVLKITDNISNQLICDKKLRA